MGDSPKRGAYADPANTERRVVRNGKRVFPDASEDVYRTVDRCDEGFDVARLNYTGRIKLR